MPPKLLAGLKSLTVGQAARMVVTAFSTIAVVWVGAEPIVKSYAGEAFKEMLKKQGVDPDVFRQVRDKTVAINSEVQQLSDDSTEIKRELEGLRNNLDRVADQIEDTNQSIDKVEALVGKLLTIQLQRADMSSSPPGTGPVGLPRLDAVQ